MALILSKNPTRHKGKSEQTCLHIYTCTDEPNKSVQSKNLTNARVSLISPLMKAKGARVVGHTTTIGAKVDLISLLTKI